MALDIQHQQEVAARIRELRGLIPQPVIADRCDVSLRAYQEWEAGGGIKWENYGKLAAALNTTVEYLMHGGGEARVGDDPGQLDRIEQALAEFGDRLARIESGLDAKAPEDPRTRTATKIREAAQQSQHSHQDTTPEADDPARTDQVS
ncbi:MAG: helix-turn-helix transcriptional regulator [Solirubrobacteraceae bacterium]|nr:helix-turn-helix transcriptional regulator [Solirubrobacteraceae bacterium]